MSCRVHQQHRSRPLTRAGVGIRSSVASAERANVNSRAGQWRRGAHGRSENSFSGLANSGSRREVRNKSFSFQGGIFYAAELFRQSRNSPVWDITAVLRPEQKDRIAASWNL